MSTFLPLFQPPLPPSNSPSPPLLAPKRHLLPPPSAQVIFIDDFNMPEKEIFGAQPPLEILRQWMQYGFWYDLKKQSARYIRDAQLVAAMGHPGGGRTQISARVLHWFHVLNMSFPDRSQLTRIFGTFIHSHLAVFDDEIKARQWIYSNPRSYSPSYRRPTLVTTNRLLSPLSSPPFSGSYYRPPLPSLIPSLTLFLLTTLFSPPSHVFSTLFLRLSLLSHPS